jgi:hypothetical protein
LDTRGFAPQIVGHTLPQECRERASAGVERIRPRKRLGSFSRSAESPTARLKALATFGPQSCVTLRSRRCYRNLARAAGPGKIALLTLWF